SARRRAQLGDLGQEREERQQVRREVGEVGALGRGAAGVAGAEVVLDELAEPLVRERLVLLDETAVENADLPHRDELLQLLEEARLSDAGFARHHRELAVSRDRGVQAALKLREFLLASDERGGRRPLESPARGADHRLGELVAVEGRAVAAKRLGELTRLLRPASRVLFEALLDDVLQLF